MSIQQLQSSKEQMANMRDEKGSSDKSPSSGEDWVTANEGCYDSNNLCSRFSDCSSEFDGVPAPEQDAESSRLLSEAENKRLNARIDLLIGALTTGRQVHFDQDPVTGKVEVTAEYDEQASESGYSDCEAAIAAYPENFGRIIRHRREMLRSPTSILNGHSSTESLIHTEYATWEDAVAAADERYEREHGPSLNNQDTRSDQLNASGRVEDEAPAGEGVGIRQAVRYLEQQAEEPRGHRLAWVSSTQLVLNEVSPIPLNFKKLQRSTTPSIHSEGSQLDCSSPLFMESYRRIPQNCDVWATESSSKNAAIFDRVSAWLDQVETPPRVETRRDEKRKGRLFGMHKDNPYDDGDLTGVQESKQVDNVLKDVSNLRQPGFLKKNSFAVEKAQAGHSERWNDATAVNPPSQGLRKMSDEGTKRAYTDRY